MKILLVVYDNDSYIHYFPQGVAYIAAVLLKKGYEVTVYNQDVYRHSEENLTNYLDQNKFDVIGVSIIAGYYQYRKLMKISSAINRSKNRPFYIIGGHGPSPEPEYFLKKTGADVAVIGEGEATILELLKAIESKASFHRIHGIAFMESDEVVITKQRELIEDIDTIPFPAYELFPMEYYRLLRNPRCTNSDFVIPVLSGRGCTFKCNFCYRMDEGFRPRKPGPIAEEIMLLKEKYGITYIAFSDELLMSSAERTVELCEYFIMKNLNVRWCCNGRLNFAKPAVLSLMKRAGCVFINYGIEAADDAVLRNMNKALTTEMATIGVEATLKEGITPGLNIIFGNIGDNKKTLDKGVEFLLKHHDDEAELRTIRPVTPYPGSPLYYYAIKKGLLKDVEEFYEKKHINSDLLSVNFTDLTDDEFHKALFEANRRLLANYFERKLASSINQARRLYVEHDPNFRGFRQT